VGGFLEFAGWPRPPPTDRLAPTVTPTQAPLDQTVAGARPSPGPYRVRFVERPDRPGLRWVLVAYVPIAIAYVLWLGAAVRWTAWSGPVMFAVLLFNVLTTTLFLWMTRTILAPVHRPTSLDSVVDAVITTHSEPIFVVEETIRTALAVRGIRDVLVLDDGARPELALLAAGLGARYHARSEKIGAKAGNLNFGLRFTNAEFLLILDADHMPLPEFLDRTLGYLDDPSVAVVQTPQTYHNDSFLFRQTRRGRWSEQDMFYKCIQPAKNRWNSAFFVGTSAVVRRRAIDDVGGFSTATATEDIHTAVRMHARGWRSVYLAEVLASGLEVQSLRELYHQRRRWAAGSMGLLLRSPDSPLWTRGLTVPQRLSYTVSMLGHQQGALRLAFQLLPIACTLTLTAPFVGSPGQFIALTAAFSLVTWFSISMHARGTFHLLHTEASLLAMCFSNLAGLLGTFMPHENFRPTRKNARADERSFVKVALWGIAALAGLALARDAQIILGPRGADRELATGCAVFITLNLVVLLDFLLPLRAYERRETLTVGSAADVPRADRPRTSRRPSVADTRLRPARPGRGIATRAARPGRGIATRAARPGQGIGTRRHRAAVAAFAAPLLLAAGAAVAPAAISPERYVATRHVATDQSAADLTPGLRRLVRRLAPASQTCGGDPAADGFGAPIVVVGTDYRTCDRFPFSTAGDGPERGPVLG
jgi:cellulose synthase/poly-beta-1,6-N-acetylglucosamine synthase-like glycosyltransferase